MWTLKITEEEFDRLYPLGNKSIFQRNPESVEDLWSNFMTSKLWRLNNLYTITDKEGNLIRFKMNWSQHMAYSTSLIHPRLIILKSRQQGISTLWLVSFFDDAIILDNFEIGLMTQGIKESKQLFTRVKRLWDKLPDFVKEYMGIKLDTDTKEEIGLSNGSKLYLQTSFRSGTLQRLHISEMGKIAAKYPDKAKETKTGSLQAIKAGNTVVVESTAEGRKNMFSYMWYEAVNFKGVRTGKDFYPVFLSWTKDPDCRILIPQRIDKEAEEYFHKLEREIGMELDKEQKWWWVSQRRELGDDIFQEYPGTPEEAFEAVRDGAYYAVGFRNYVEKTGHIITNINVDGVSMTYMNGGLYDPALKVEVAMDLGMNDTMVLVFFQLYKREIRLIDEYHNSGEGLSHYVNVMKDKPYKYGSVHVPHDATVRELGTGISRVKRLQELGVRARVLKRVDVNSGIEQVRKLLPNLWIDGDKCQYLIDTFYNYSKEWDDKGGCWKDKPLHDEWSNPADAIRYLAMSIKLPDADEEGPGRSKRLRSNVVNGMAM